MNPVAGATTYLFARMVPGGVKSKATGMGRPWQQSLGILKDWCYAAKRRRAHTIVFEQ